MKAWFKLLRILILAAMLLSLPGLPRPVQAAAITPQAVKAASTWCVAGSFQGWNNSSDPMYDDGTHGDLIPGDEIYTLEFVLPTAGRHEFKVVKCGDWGQAYPSDNAWAITVGANETVVFTFDANAHGGDAGLNLNPKSNIVNVWDSADGFTAVGDFQGWNNSDAATALTYVGNGYYRYEFVQPTAGTYYGKVVLTGTWDGFGSDGRNKNAGNLSYTTTTADQRVVVLLDLRSGRAAFLPQITGAGTFCVASSFNGWSANANPLYDDGTHGDLSGGDGIFSADIAIATAGRNEWKVTVCDWATSYPSSNSFVTTTTNGQTIKFTFDTSNHSADAGWKLYPTQFILNAWDGDPAAISAAGTFNVWDNNDDAYTLEAKGNGLFLLAKLMVPGPYDGKLVLKGTWDAWGADNRSINASTVNFSAFFVDEPVYFLLDHYTSRMMIFAVPPAFHDLDNLVEVNGLKHDSQDGLYRTPFGAISEVEEAYIRFRTFHNDVEKVRVRLYNTTNAAESFENMTLVGSDLPCYQEGLERDTCDYWQLHVAGLAPTNLYYRFIVYDGTDVAYYADDNMKDGGLGVVTDTMVDNSYVITVYEDGFQPVGWMQDAVIYQIFPDRFYNADKSNDPSGHEPRFSYPPETIDQIFRKLWTDLPEGYCRGYVNPAEECSEQPYGRDFYGGDLQGVIDKLDYLQELGVTVIYFNPIFAAGDNHGYNTRDYLNIQPYFGDNELFETLVAEADLRGIRIVLDGVFNHVSSDSPYFDRYHHYDGEWGACESLVSPYRDWFYWTQTLPGEGQCVGVLGENSATYDSWWGFDSIPVMDKSNLEVQDLFLYGTGTQEPVATFWLDEGAAGWRLDVMNDSTFPSYFWQEFRGIVKGNDPEAVIIGELWKKGDVLPMVLGDTADTAMNYRFRNAVQGLLGQVDNKGFADDGQSDQPPSMFARKMVSIREDYPDATYYTLMNLLTTHDTERILWGLTPGEDNREDKEFNAANLEIGKERLMLAAVIQMTVPGAPTIYYGDEVGMTGFDDPDDRRAFPWMQYYFLPLVAKNSAFSSIEQVLNVQIKPVPVNYYGALGDHDLLDHYRNLTAIRHANPVFSQGELTFLLTDDEHETMAYLLRTADDAALVAVNKSDTTQTLTIDSATYLPYTYEMVDALGTLTAPVTALNSELSFDLPAMSAAILLPTAGQDLLAPDAREFSSVLSANGKVEVGWQITKAADTYAVYRSYFTGGGYELLGITSDEVYTDTSVTNGMTYYYTLRTIDDLGNYSAYTAEISATPYVPIGWAGNLTPATINTPISSTPLGPISAEIWIDGMTNVAGNEDQIWAQLGYAPSGSALDVYQWADIPYTGTSSNNYVYGGTIRPEAVGSYDYLIRFTTSRGLNWTYAYVTGTTPGVLTLTAAADVTSPNSPYGLWVEDYGVDFIDLTWYASTSIDVVEYWVYRRPTTTSTFTRIGIVNAPTTSFYDGDVQGGVEYEYYVIAVDGALNKSYQSNSVYQTAEVRIVMVLFELTVPFFTPITDVIYITGDTAPLEWNPSAYPMVPDDENPFLRRMIVPLPDGATVQYKYARGSWEKVEWWGSITGLTNRSFVVDYNNPIATDTVENWRDPLVVSTWPYTTMVIEDYGYIDVFFNVDIQPLEGEDFSNSIQVMINGVDYTDSGIITQEDTDQLRWTPGPDMLPIGAYSVTVSNLRRVGGDGDIPMQAPYTFVFVVPSK